MTASPQREKLWKLFLPKSQLNDCHSELSSHLDFIAESLMVAFLRRVWVWLPILGRHQWGGQGLHQVLDVRQCGAQTDLRGGPGALLDHWSSVWEEHPRHGLRTTQEELCQVSVEGEISRKLSSSKQLFQLNSFNFCYLLLDNKILHNFEFFIITFFYLWPSSFLFS